MGFSNISIQVTLFQQIWQDTVLEHRREKKNFFFERGWESLDLSEGTEKIVYGRP